MRVAIVTVFNEYFNYGSYLQAFALQEYLRKHEIEPELVEENRVRRFFRKVRGVVTRDIKRLIFNIQRYFVYAIANRQLISAPLDPKRPYDAVILGSDEIWNLHNKTFDHTPMFFGVGFNSPKRISYAPSVNRMKPEDFASRTLEKEALNQIDFLSARDPRTGEIIKSVTGKDPVEVLDPTFLLDWSSYEKPNTQRKYILVYAYNLKPERLAQIEELAKKLEAKIIFIGHFSNTGHTLITPDPFYFLGYLKSASAVITDSYHGTIFAIQYNKPFCSFVGDNYKIASILERLNLKDRDATTTTSLVELFGRAIDYAGVNEKMSIMRQRSKQFLNDALGIR